MRKCAVAAMAMLATCVPVRASEMDTCRLVRGMRGAPVGSEFEADRKETEE